MLNYITQWNTFGIPAFLWKDGLSDSHAHSFKYYLFYEGCVFVQTRVLFYGWKTMKIFNLDYEKTSFLSFKYTQPEMLGKQQPMFLFFLMH